MSDITDILHKKELAVIDHIKAAALDVCECEPCTAVREIIARSKSITRTPMNEKLRERAQQWLSKYGMDPHSPGALTQLLAEVEGKARLDEAEWWDYRLRGCAGQTTETVARLAELQHGRYGVMSKWTEEDWRGFQAAMPLIIIAIAAAVTFIIDMVNR